MIDSDISAFAKKKKAGSPKSAPDKIKDPAGIGEWCSLARSTGAVAWNRLHAIQTIDVIGMDWETGHTDAAFTYNARGIKTKQKDMPKKINSKRRCIKKVEMGMKDQDSGHWT
jgi:hypothetical protein